MKARLSFAPAEDADQTVLSIASQAEDGDDPEGKHTGTDVMYWLPRETESAHPDLLALTAILVLHPFTTNRLSVNVPVSREFAAACERWLPYRCDFLPTPLGVDIAPRARGTVPALSFSGGVDSVAALAVMPQNTECVFLDRVAPSGEPSRSLYNKDSALVACDMIEALGYPTRRIASTMEYVRNPIGFPVDWSCGTPAVLMADMLDLASIAWGVVAESAYRVGSTGFANFPDRTIFKRWDQLLRAVGLQLAAPVAGVSEVGTSMIERKSPLAGVGQSCIRGPKGSPCLACRKCLRKVPLDAVLDGRSLSGEAFESMIRFPGAAGFVLAHPIKHEDVFRWTAERLVVEGESPAWDAFKARLDVDDLDVSWATTWYEPAVDLIPDEYRTHAVAALREYLDEQDPAQASAFEAWDLLPTIQSTVLGERTERLRQVLEVG